MMRFRFVFFLFLIITSKGEESTNYEGHLDDRHNNKGDEYYLDELNNISIPIQTKSRLFEYARDPLPRHTFWIDQSSAYFNVIFKPYNWIEVVDPANAAVVLLSGRKRSNYLAGPGTPFNKTSEIPYLLSKIENVTKYLTNKDAIHYTLASIPDGQGLYAQTRTFVIASGKDCADFYAHPKSNLTTWVKKLTWESEGRGLEIFPVGGKSEICNTTDWKAEDRFGRFILQAHIDHPFLLKKKKSEMRAYWLIASVDPLIVLMYNDGSVRLATSDYEDVSFHPTNALKHIVNTRQQKLFDRKYEETADERKWSWFQLAEYLNELDRIQVEPQEWIDNSLKPAFAKILKTSVEGAKANLQEDNHEQKRRFELFGIDVILEDEDASKDSKRYGLEDGGVPLDGKLRMWMTELQLGPDLGMSSATKKAFIPPMLQEAMNIVLEIDQNRHEGKSLSNISSINNFEVVVNEADETGDSLHLTKCTDDCAPQISMS